MIITQGTAFIRQVPRLDRGHKLEILIQEYKVTVHPVIQYSLVEPLNPGWIARTQDRCLPNRQAKYPYGVAKTLQLGEAGS